MNVSEMLGIEEYNRPNDNFPFPHMDCCFLKDNKIFMNMFRTSTKKMVMATFDLQTC